MSISNAFGLQDLVSSAVRRRLPGSVADDDRIRVEVRVRSYDDALELSPADSTSVPWSQAGRLPVGTLLDCYA
ncbi:MAG: hypothetical protein JSW27_21125 [Phycisphaerales bacterium]|nr:MAG: hypothetical protein JSW27_21125 [Phycisphaerales bacterium]